MSRGDAVRIHWTERDGVVYLERGSLIEYILGGVEEVKAEGKYPLQVALRERLAKELRKVGPA